MPTFFVASDAVAPPTIRITGSLLVHLKDSLRVQPGERLSFTDDRPVRYRAEVTDVTAQQLVARILETIQPPPRSSPSLILAQALLKGEKMDWVIQKATELGVDRIVPLLAKHTVVKLKEERVEHQVLRWRRITLEAAQQSERWSVPIIEEPSTLAQLFARYGNCVSKNILAERSTGNSLTTTPLPGGPDNSILLVIGPEGGWDQEELLLAEEHGCRALTVGTRILRAETAALAAVSIVQSRLGELG